ncbi:hypothetical protein mRhiFer1_008512 [Rhinolophus ferrumequinum]|uniref:Uncharacterized protein n=1 Tax=Rhinolophus ferrumequinum TaxID=59479 RepID=A0A7J7UX81_RHIFE|nr:hypothetical protein mRhiFer1_008512 [Rhinolophus ferrumequinum]
MSPALPPAVPRILSLRAESGCGRALNCLVAENPPSYQDPAPRPGRKAPSVALNPEVKGEEAAMEVWYPSSSCTRLSPGKRPPTHLTLAEMRGPRLLRRSLATAERGTREKPCREGLGFSSQPFPPFSNYLEGAGGSA